MGFTTGMGAGQACGCGGVDHSERFMLGLWLFVASTGAIVSTHTAARSGGLPPLSRAILLPEHAIGSKKTDFSELKMEFVPTPTVAPMPALGTGQVLVRVHASSVNPVDIALVRSLTAPRIPGSDIAGEVVAVGPGCTSPISKVGTQVYGLLNNLHDPCPTSWPGSASCMAAGAWADYAVASENMLNTKPAQLSMTEAAVRSHILLIYILQRYTDRPDGYLRVDAAAGWPDLSSSDAAGWRTLGRLQQNSSNHVWCWGHWLHWGTACQNFCCGPHYHGGCSGPDTLGEVARSRCRRGLCAAALRLSPPPRLVCLRIGSPQFSISS